MKRGAEKLCGWAAGVALAGMMLITVADVVMRAASNRPIRGTLEIVELFLACAFFLALPAAILRDEHIVVDVIDGMAPRWVPMLKRVAVLLGALVFAAMLWQGWLAARDAVAFNDVTSDLALPRLWYWIPVLLGMLGSLVACVAMFFHSEGR